MAPTHDNGLNKANNWLKLVGAILTILIVGGSLFGSYAVSQYQIKDLRDNQRETDKKVEENQETMQEVEIKVERLDVRQQVIDENVKHIRNKLDNN